MCYAKCGYTLLQSISILKTQNDIMGVLQMILNSKAFYTIDAFMTLNWVDALEGD